MSNEKKETVADIVAEMRALGRLDEKSTDKIPRSFQALGLRTYADRIEAAEKREREAGAEAAQICGEIGEMVVREAACHQPVTDCHGLNAAAMREALKQIANMSEQIDNQLGSSEETVYAFRNERCIAHNISECARSALSAPPRNCDVGTVEEQVMRFREFCLQRKCSECQFKDNREYGECLVHWAQMPYKEVK